MAKFTGQIVTGAAKDLRQSLVQLIAEAFISSFILLGLIVILDQYVGSVPGLVIFLTVFSFVCSFTLILMTISEVYRASGSAMLLIAFIAVLLFGSAAMLYWLFPRDKFARLQRLHERFGSSFDVALLLAWKWWTCLVVFSIITCIYFAY